MGSCQEVRGKPLGESKRFEQRSCAAYYCATSPRVVAGSHIRQFYGVKPTRGGEGNVSTDSRRAARATLVEVRPTDMGKTDAGITPTSCYLYTFPIPDPRQSTKLTERNNPARCRATLTRSRPCDIRKAPPLNGEREPTYVYETLREELRGQTNESQHDFERSIEDG